MDKLTSGIYTAFRTLEDNYLEKYFQDSSDKAWILLESSSMMHIALSTLKSLPYVLYSESFFPNIPQFFSNRFNYLESTLIAIVSLVRSVVLAVFYTVLNVVTLAQSPQLTYAFRKHWSHVGFDMACIGMGAMGVISPSLGALVTFHVIFWQLRSIHSDFEHDVELFEDPLIVEIKSLYQKHRNTIHEILENRDRIRYRETILPFFEKKIEPGLKEMKKIKDLKALLIYTYQNFNKSEEEEVSTKTPIRPSTSARHYFKKS